MTNTPSEAPGRSGPATSTTEQKTARQSITQEALRVQERENQLRRTSSLRRAGGIAGAVVTAGALTGAGSQAAASDAPSGFAVETWGRVPELAHSAGAWATQLADQIAAQPGASEATMMIGAAMGGALANVAIRAGLPYLLDATESAYESAYRSFSRWANQAGSSLSEGLKNAYNKVIRANPKTQADLKAADVDSKGSLTALSETNGATGGQLPSTSDMRQKALWQDGSQKPLTGVTVKAGEREGKSATPESRSSDKPRTPGLNL